MSNGIGRRAALTGALGAGALGAVAGVRPARAAGPITIGMSLSLTGPLAVSGRAIALTMKMFEADFNKQGGVHGRPIRFIHYDDQSNPSNAPQIYTKLLDIDKVDLLMSNGTNLTAPAMPVVMQHDRLVIVMFSLGINDKFHYPRFFQTMPYGPNGKMAISKGFFEAAATIVPKVKTIALVGADADFSKTAVAGARAHAKELGLKIVYDRTYPPSTVDYDPIVRGIGAARPDVIYVGSYPLDTVGMIRSAHSLKLRPKLFGGSMVGTQIGSLKAELGEELNGVVSYELYVPAVAKFFPEVEPFLQRYRPIAVKEGVDPLGFYMPPFVYASCQVLTQAVAAVGLDQGKLAEHIHAATFKTMVGDIKFGADGEWAHERMLHAQFRGVKGNDVQQFMDPAREVVISPAEYKTGDLVTPFGTV
jgi:branched-chain amino acid transport system substrate-binding protein